MDCAKLMKNDDEIRPVILNLEPTEEELSKVNLRERRNGLQDRRMIPTYIANDRRCGIADRRKQSS
jgi:hypothetical protein